MAVEVWNSLSNMKRFLNIGMLLLTMAVLVVACEQPVLGPFEGELPNNGPHFLVQATVGGAPLNLQAGVDGDILKAIASPDSAGPLAMRCNSDLVKRDNQTNAPGLSISLLHSPLNTLGAHADSALAPGFLFLEPLDGLSAAQLVRLRAEIDETTPFDPVESVRWEFLDGTTENGIEIVKAFPEFPTVQWVQYNVTHQSGCQRTIWNLFRVTGSTEFELNLDRNPGDNVQVEVGVPGPQSTWDVEVDMGDGSPVRNDFNFTHHYNQPGVYIVEARVYTNNNNPTLVWVFRKEVATNPQDCYAAFDYELEGTSTMPFHGRRAQVIYTDGYGKTYVSMPNNGAQMAILHHEPFMPNPLGQQVYLTDLQVNTWLFNESNPLDSLFFASDTLRFGFAF